MPSPLQSVSNKATGTITTLSTAITATSAGSCLVIYVLAFGDSSSPTTVTITSGTGGTGGSFAADNWTAATTSLGGAGMDAGIWVDPNAATSTNAVKITTNGSGTQTIAVIIEEWAGLATASVVDATATPLRQSTAGNTTWSVGPTGTTAQASELVVACAASFNVTTSSFTLGTPGAPWTEETQVQQTSGFYQLLASGWQSVSSTGTFSYNGTAVHKTTACIATLKFAPGGTTPSDTEAARATETATITASLSTPETMQAIEAASIQASLGTPETFRATEAQSVVTPSAPHDTDAVVATESKDIAAGPRQDTDAVQATETTFGSPGGASPQLYSVIRTYAR